MSLIVRALMVVACLAFPVLVGAVVATGRGQWVALADVVGIVWLGWVYSIVRPVSPPP